MYTQIGEIKSYTFDSSVLKNNPLGDPTQRQLFVYLPPNYENIKNKAIPAVVGVVGYTGTGAMLFNHDPLDGNLKDKLDSIILQKKCPPFILVLPDCFTSVGGNQYFNSPGTGQYGDYIAKEIVPFVEKNFSISNWGAFGSSSGGVGSFYLNVFYPDVFKAMAMHCPDSNFELCFIPDILKAMSVISKAGGLENWKNQYLADEIKRRPKYREARLVLGLAAHYSPNPSNAHGIDLPFDIETGQKDLKVWQKWLEYDPITMVQKYINILKNKKCIYLDCGINDEFGYIWGARALSDEFKKHQIPHDYDEFDGGHFDVKNRYPKSLIQIVKHLQGQ